MKLLERLESTIFDIRQLLSTDETIVKLLLNDSPSALSQALPTGDPNQNIIVAPVFDVTEPPYDKNTLISINIDKADYDHESVFLATLLKVTVLTRTELWELDDHKIRPMQIANNIIEKLNDRKLTTSHKLYFIKLDLAVLNDKVTGFILHFGVDEGSGLDAKF